MIKKYYITNMPASIHDDIYDIQRKIEMIKKYYITHMPASIHDDIYEI